MSERDPRPVYCHCLVRFSCRKASRSGTNILTGSELDISQVDNDDQMCWKERSIPWPDVVFSDERDVRTCSSMKCSTLQHPRWNTLLGAYMYPGKSLKEMISTAFITRTFPISFNHCITVSPPTLRKVCYKLDPPYIRDGTSAETHSVRAASKKLWRIFKQSKSRSTDTPRL